MTDRSNVCIVLSMCKTLQIREGGRYVYVIDNIIRCAAMTLQIVYLNSQSEEEKTLKTCKNT